MNMYRSKSINVSPAGTMERKKKKEKKNKTYRVIRVKSIETKMTDETKTKGKKENK